MAPILSTICSTKRLNLRGLGSGKIQNRLFLFKCARGSKQLSLRHLSAHDLNPRSYRVKYNIPRTQALSARAVTARRRELAQEIRPWELALSKAKAGSKAAAKPKAKAAAAKPAASRAKAKKTAAKT